MKFQVIPKAESVFLKPKRAAHRVSPIENIEFTVELSNRVTKSLPHFQDGGENREIVY